MSRSTPSPTARPRIVPSKTIATPLLSPTGASCTTKPSSPTSTQASTLLSQFSSRTGKVRSAHGNPTASNPASQGSDYFSRRPYPLNRAVTVGGTGVVHCEKKGNGYASAYVSFPEFDQYQRRDGISAEAR